MAEESEKKPRRQRARKPKVEGAPASEAQREADSPSAEEASSRPSS